LPVEEEAQEDDDPANEDEVNERDIDDANEEMD
jgi:hypothetical protein